MFVTQGPVDPDSPLFIGRVAEVQRLEGWVAEANCVGSVLGARQTGKTSLLLQLRKRCLAKYSIAYISLDAIGEATQAQCYIQLSQELLNQLDVPIGAIRTSDPADTRAFMTFLRELADAHPRIRIAVLLDGLGALGMETAFHVGQCLRAVFTNRLIDKRLARYVFILAGARETLELATGRNSPLRNVTQSVYLGDLTETDCSALLTRGMETQAAPPSADVCADVYRWTSGHPYLTQLIGSVLLEAAAQQSPADLQDVVQRVLQTEDKNLPHIREALTDAKRPELWAAIQEVRGPNRLWFTRSDPVLAELELIGALSNRDGWCAIRNQVYQAALDRWTETSEWSPSRPSDDGGRFRLASLERGIDEELALLEDYERVLREEGDPRRRRHIRSEIDQIRESLARSRREHDSLRGR